MLAARDDKSNNVRLLMRVSTKRDRCESNFGKFVSLFSHIAPQFLNFQERNTCACARNGRICLFQQFAIHNLYRCSET